MNIIPPDRQQIGRDAEQAAVLFLEARRLTILARNYRCRSGEIDIVAETPEGVVVIAESHLSIHTWPEHRYAAVDIFSCGETLKPAEAANYLVEQFGASRASCVEVKRGVFPGTPGAVANRVKEGVAANGSPEPLQMVF